MTSLKSQKENRKKLVEALRSGKYSQTQGQLKDPTGYCCLGVACDISQIGYWDESHDYSGIRDALYDDKIMNFYGFRTATARFEQKLSDFPVHIVQIFNNRLTSEEDDIVSSSLITLNDELGLTFSEIADIIESEPKGLFRE